MLTREQLELSFEAKVELWSADEIFFTDSPSVIRAVNEGRQIERKPVGMHANALGIYFSMWANTPPDGGIIAIGVSDDGTIEGVSKTSANHLNDLERTGDIYCPDARYKIRYVPCVNAKGEPDQIMLIRVFFRADKVATTVDHQTWIRRGESKKRLTMDEVHELRMEKGELSFEQEPSVLKYPEDFNTKAVGVFANAVSAKLGLEQTKSAEEILETRRLGKIIRGKFVPNKACALLFASDPCREIPGCKIRFLRFDGKEMGTGEQFNAVKDEFLEGAIPEQIIQAERVLESQLREFSKMGKDGKFASAKEYPKSAWYEAVVNACCHRSYSMRTIPIFIKMFDDRLEIESPGGFMPSVNPQNIYDTHNPRNPDMMAALWYLDFVKLAHEGTRRMRQTMKDLQLPEPIFSENQTTGTFFRVVLKNNVEHRKAWLDTDAMRIVGERIFKTLDEHDMRIVNYVAEYKKINTSDVMRLTGRNWHSSRKKLRDLARRGILAENRRQKMDRDTKAHYVLPN
jgi:ATP-dependent DNA helicase RecG